MNEYAARDPGYEAKLRAGLAAMPAARHLGFEIVELAPGTTRLEPAFRPELAELTGAFQGAVIGALVDYAGVAAIGTLAAADEAAVTLDYHVKLMAPARGRRLIATGQVVGESGATGYARAEIEIEGLDGARRLCATGLATARRVKLAGKRAA